LNVVLVAEWNGTHLISTEDKVVAKLIGSYLHSTRHSFFELIDTKVGTSDMLHLASFLKSLKSLESTSGRRNIGLFNFSS
jgi:hypothetical protein